MHELACYVFLAETKSLPESLRTPLVEKLRRAVAASVERNPAKWDTYCLPPLGLVRSPDSPFADLFPTELPANLDFEIQRQDPDGSWHPTWSWSSPDPAAWPKAQLTWQGVLTLNILKTLAAFRRLP